MITELISFSLGVALAPFVRPRLRPLFIEFINFVFTAIHEAQRASARIKEELEDVVAEANVKAKPAAKPTQSSEKTPDDNSGNVKS